MALPNTPVGYDSWNSYIEINAPALAASQGITLQQAKASLKLLNVSEPIRGAVGEPYYREYNVFTTWADRALLPEPGRPWKLAPSFTVLSLFAQGEQGAWYDPSDLTTMYQTSTGTTPVTAAGQQVGLLLDKSQGLVLGPERVTNGTFDANITGWTNTQGGTIAWDASGGIAVTAAADGADANAQTSITTTVGRTYKVTWTVVSAEGGWLFRIRNSADYNYQSVSATTGTFTAYVVSSAISNTVNLLSTDASKKVVFDNISVRELPGNHATQATSAQRPTLGRNPVTGTRNLLTYTEQFNNAAWFQTGLGTSVIGNTATAPDNTSTADTLRETTDSGLHYIATSSAYVAFVSGTNYTISTYVKKGAGASAPDIVQLTLNATYFGTSQYANYNISTGVVTSSTGGTATIEAAGNGWYRISWTAIATSSGAGNVSVVFFCNNNPTSARSPSYVGSTTTDILIWGAQLETGSTATAYQRVVSAFDVTQAGVADAWYLSCDGTDDFMVTNTITPGIDKAQVFAGVRKLSDATIGMVAETSSNAGSNNGSLYMAAPLSTGASSDFAFSTRGTSSATAAGGAALSPISRVLTGIGDIAADTSIIRINGAQAAQSTADQGTGNYLAYPLYIGRRNGTQFPFNGRIYSLIVRFGANLTQQQILDTETWVGEKTGINIPLWVSPTVYDSSNNPVLDQFNQTIELY